MALEPKSLSRYLAAAAAGGATGAALNLVLYFVATGVLGVAMSGEVNGPGTGVEHIPALVVAVASLLPALIGGVLAWGLHRLTDKGPTLMLGLGAVVLLVFLVPPATLSMASIGTVVVLEVMHLLVGVPVLFLLHKASQPR
jgi:hypothetical protein